MKLYRAHDGLSLSLPAPPAATSTLADLLDCVSLATGISSDQIICMTADGAQLHPENYRSLLSLDPADGSGPPSAPPDTHSTDLEFFIYNREYLYAEPNALAQQLALPPHLEQPLSHIDELPEPGTPHYATAVLPWAMQALSLIRTHASRAHLAYAALSNMHRASAIALANLLQYHRTIAAGADALNGSVGAELARMKDLLDGYERDLRILGMVPIDPRLLNPSSRDSTTSTKPAQSQPQQQQPSSSSPASTPSSQGHGVSAQAAGPSKRLGDYVSRQRMSAVASACARVHTELAARFVNLHNHLNALQTDVQALEGEVHSVDLGPASEGAEAAREARQRAEEIVERGLMPWLSGALLGNDHEYQQLMQEGLLPPFPLGPAPGPAHEAEFPVERDQDRLHNQLEEALTELVLLDEVTRASVLRLSQDRNDMQARIITFLQDISAVQSDLGELAEAMDVFEKEEMPPGAGVRQSIKAQQLAQAQAQASLAHAKANSQANLQAQPQAGNPTSAAAGQLFVAHQQSTNFSMLHTVTAGAFVLDGFRPNMAPIVAAAAGAGTGIGAPAPGSASTTSNNQGQVRIDGFRHLARLHHMLLAYGATLVELVRRATFSRLFLKSAQSVAELMALVSEREVERRKEWRKAGVGSILPWDVRALSLVPMSGSAGGVLAASAFGDEGTPVLEISTKGMISLHAASTGASSGIDPLAAALAAAAELGREDVDRLFGLLDDIERALDQEAELARESQAAIAIRRRSSALRQHSTGGSFALPQGQRSPATPPHPGSTLQSPVGQNLPLLPVNPIPEVRAALQLLVEEIDDMEPEFRDLVNVTLLERKSRFRRRRASRRAGNGTFGDGPADGEEEQTSDAEDDDSDDDEEGQVESVLNSGNRTGRRAAPRASRRALRKQIKELTAKVAEAEATTASAHAALEAAQTENGRLRTNLAHLSEEHHSAYGAIRVELESVRAESRSNAEAYDRARHARDDALAQVEALRNEVDTEAARRLNLEEEVTNVRRDLKEARKEAGEAKREALEIEERLAELDVQTSELQHELDNAVRAREDVCNRMEGLLKEGSSAERELASAQSRIEELNREVSAARTEVREAKEALAEAESARDKLIRTYRAEADGDRAILEENVRNKDQELRLAKEGLKNAETARKAAEAREAAERTVSDGLRGQLEAADVAHETMLRDLEETREEGSKLEARLRDATDERDELLRLVRPLIVKIQALRKVIKSLPILTSSSKSTDRDGKVGNGGDSSMRERSTSSTSVTSEIINGGSNGTQASSTSTVKPNGLLNAAMEAFESEGENSASLAMTLAALRALEPRLFHDEVKGKLDSLTLLVRKWQKAYKLTQDKISRAQASARDRIAYRNFQVGDLVLFLPTRNTSSRTFAAFNRGYPHYFLRAEGAFGEQVRSKDYLLDRITAVTERVAGSAVGGAPVSGDGSADGTNPYQLAEGVRYHILDVEGALSSGISNAVPPRTPHRGAGVGSMPPRSVSHGPPARRDSSTLTTPSSSTTVSTSSPPAPTVTTPAPLATPGSATAGSAAAPSAPSGLTLSRSTSRSFDRLTATLSENEQAAAGGSTATITPLNSANTTFAGPSGPSPIEGGSSVPVPAFGTRARGAMKRRAPGDGSGEAGLGSTSVSPGSGANAIAPSAPMPISMPRGSNGNSAADGGGGEHMPYLQLANYDRSFGTSRPGASGAGAGALGSKAPTAAEFERGLKDATTSRAIAEALAAEGLQNIGNPFSASPSGVGSLLERNNSFGGRGSSLPTGPVNAQGLPASPLRTQSSSTRRREAGSSSSSSGSNLSRARREGAFRRSGAGSGLSTPMRTGFYPSRGSGSGHSPASAALAVESRATAHGETSLFAVPGGRSDSSLWRADSQSSPRSSADAGRMGGAGPSWAGGSSRPSSTAMMSPTPSPSARMQRQLSSGAGSGSGSGFSDIPPGPSGAGGGMLGLIGARPSNASNLSQAGGSDVSFPRSRTHTGSGSTHAVPTGGTLGRTNSAASRKDSFGSGFLSSLTFGRASARKHSMQGQTRPGGEEDASLSSTLTPGGGPRRSTLEVILGWPGGSASTTTAAGSASGLPGGQDRSSTAAAGRGGDAKGKRAVRGSVSEGGGVLGEVDEILNFEVGSPGSEAGSATAAEMLRRLARN
ncbi:oligomeric, coiled-coil, peripheral membrane protein [Tilletia horrida]|uniref:Oligomeric, coiled-coil, peripheral membrane protein n=1 Tax=Tilletia horrida TaxID=155126 RepID=A0AAN6JJ13_9BASI|nr:oligomeric, coiled-coil, peripheral membrane protein [Tilletia horrida]